VGWKHGLGRHEFYLNEDQKIETGKYSALSIFFCISALNIAKISACLSLLRIIKGSDKRFLRWFLSFMIILQFAINVVVCTTLWVQCSPVRKVWTPALPGHCWPPTVQQRINYLQAALSCATDFLLAGLPLYILKDLQLSPRTKHSLSILMSFGMITGILAIVRSIYLEPYARTMDPSWTDSGLLIWGGVERNTGIIVACIPFMRPLLQTPLVKSVLGYTSSKLPYGKRSGYLIHSDQSHELSNQEKSAAGKPSNRSDIFIEDHTGRIAVPPSTLSRDMV